LPSWLGRQTNQDQGDLRTSLDWD